MKILMVRTSKFTKYGKTGTRRRIDTIAELLSLSNKLAFLQPFPSTDKDKISQSTDKKVYYFKEWSFLGNQPLYYFSDWNIDFLLKLKLAVKKEKPDLILVSFPYGISVGSLICLNIPIIYESHDVDSDTVEEFAFKGLQVKHKVFRLPVIRSVAKWMLKSYFYLMERIACKRAAHIIAITEEDKSKYVEEYGVSECKITVIPPSVPVVAPMASLEERPAETKDKKIAVVFVGTYCHMPNQEVVDLIVNYIAPQVRRFSDRIQFLLAGIGLPSFEKENIKSLGYVENISSFFQEADIAILPQLSGTGVEEKLFDYMAFGLPIVTTRKGARGLMFENGKHAIILDTVDEEFIDAILKLANDEEERQRLRKNIVDLARHNYSQETMRARLDMMLNILNIN